MGLDDNDYADNDFYASDYADDVPTPEEIARDMAEFRAWKERRNREAAGQPSLAEFLVDWKRLTRATVTSFLTTLDAATEESDLQKFLEENPEVLAQVHRGGHGRWSIPQKRLGSEHVTDFVIADKSSIGFEWSAVELESPHAKMFTKKGDPTAVLTHAIRQITDWRDWLSHNRDYATRPRDKSGLGLVDVDPQLAGLIVMGRRADLDPTTADRRRSVGRELRIEIRTYDWLLDTAAEAARSMDSARQEPVISADE